MIERGPGDGLANRYCLFLNRGIGGLLAVGSQITCTPSTCPVPAVKVDRFEQVDVCNTLRDIANGDRHTKNARNIIEIPSAHSVSMLTEAARTNPSHHHPGRTSSALRSKQVTSHSMS